MKKILLLTIFFTCAFAANSQAQIVTATSLDVRSSLQQSPIYSPEKLHENFVSLSLGLPFEITYSRLTIRNSNGNNISGILGYGVNLGVPIETAHITGGWRFDHGGDKSLDLRFNLGFGVDIDSDAAIRIHPQLNYNINKFTIGMTAGLFTFYEDPWPVVAILIGHRF